MLWRMLFREESFIRRGRGVVEASSRMPWQTQARRRAAIAKSAPSAPFDIEYFPSPNAEMGSKTPLRTILSLVVPAILAVGAFYAIGGLEAMPALPPPGPAGLYPGDDVIPDAVMIYDQTKLIKAPPSAVWPWVQQVGKGRGGWYTTQSWERFLPLSMHASRSIKPEWQQLKQGDKIDDYGFSADDYFIVEEVQSEQALVLKSERYGALFSWSLILHQQPEEQTLLHLRFRGKIAATGLKRRVIVWGGGWMDHITVRPVSNISNIDPSRVPLLHSVTCVVTAFLTLAGTDALRLGRTR